MGFSEEWDRKYQENSNMSVWPWSELVSLVMRRARPDSPLYSVLELGCGAGANIPFFQWLGVEYYGIDGSPFIIDWLKKKYAELEDRLVAADFTKSIPFGKTFDLIVDKSSMTHNPTEDIAAGMELVRKHLKPGGKFIGVGWFSTEHADYKRGEEVDVYTRRNLPDRHMSGLGNIHFFDKDHLLNVFAGFEIKELEHVIVKKSIPEDEHQLAWWNLFAERE